MLVVPVIMLIEDTDDYAFMSELYIEHYNFMRKAVLEITGSLEHFDDISQNACISLIEKLPILRGLDSHALRTYVFVTVKRTAINFLRSHHARSKHQYLGWKKDALDEISENVADGTKNVEDAIVNSASVEALEAALFKLPDKDRALLEFKYILNMTDTEIASVLGIKPQSVREYLTRARRKAFNILKSEGFSNV